MRDFLKTYKDYEGSNPKLKAFAEQLAICEDGYDDMFDILLEELGEQKVDNPMYDNVAEHELCYNET